MKIYSSMQASEVFGTIEELCESDMMVEFGSFKSDKTGETVFSCKIKAFNKYGGGVTEHGRGFGDTPLAAFSKAYQKLNEGNYR